MKNFLKSLKLSGILGLSATLLIIIVAEYLFLTGNELQGIFVGLWAPTFLGFLIFLNLKRNGN